MKRNHLIQFRVTATEEQQIKLNASKLGYRVSDYARYLTTFPLMIFSRAEQTQKTKKIK